jgi:cell division protein FtsW
MSLISRSDRGVLARWWFTVDRALLSATLLLMAVGVLVSMAASPPVATRIGLDPYHFVKSQLFYLGLAIVGMLFVSVFDRQWVRRLGLAGFVGSLVLMWLALKFGAEIKGAHRWIDVGPINLQPSEFAKPCFVIVFAWMLSERIRFRDMPGHLIAYGAAGILLFSLILQPDFGQAALVVATIGAMLLVYGIPWTVVLGLSGVGAAAVAVSYAFVPHVTSRIDRFLNPENGDTFQVDTSVQAFHNGGILGAGPGGGTAKLVLPDAHTDFTFSVIGEEFGLIACVAIMVLFLFIIIRVLKRAKGEQDAFAALAMAGVTSMFAIQASINMGVNVGLLPAKGMTLPMISYGGSSLLGTALAIGFLLSLGRQSYANYSLASPVEATPDAALAGAA